MLDIKVRIKKMKNDGLWSEDFDYLKELNMRFEEGFAELQRKRGVKDNHGNT